MEILKLHSTGENVRELQKILGIFADGIYGKQTESLVKQWQKDNGLVPDGIVGEKTWNRLNSTILSPEIVYNPINVHISKLPNRTIKYLVIHFTAGASSKEGSALKNREVFLTRDASADYVVDDATILQVNPDPFNYYCWAVGDGKGKNGIYNKDCISIELCSNLKPGTTAKVPNHEG